MTKKPGTESSAAQGRAESEELSFTDRKCKTAHLSTLCRKGETPGQEPRNGPKPHGNNPPGEYKTSNKPYGNPHKQA